MARMAQLAADLAEIDAEIQRLLEQGRAHDGDEFRSGLDRIQIDELLERRYRLYPKEEPCSPPP